MKSAKDDAQKQEDSKRAAGSKPVQMQANGTLNPLGAQTSAPKRVVTIPDELKSLQKSEVNFFLERIPSLMKNGDATEFYKLLELYLEGVITKYEFFDIVDPLILPSEKENLRQIQTLLSSRESSRRSNKPLLTPLSEYKVRRQD